MRVSAARRSSDDLCGAKRRCGVEMRDFGSVDEVSTSSHAELLFQELVRV
jgi:hypothetical protein